MLNAQAHTRSYGFTLVEVLVAVFILSIGMLGIAALQVTSKRANYEATQRTTATLLAQELLERIRANSESLSFYTNDGNGRTIGLDPSANIAETDCASTPCSESVLAMYDLYEFSRALAGAGEISGGSESGGLVSPIVCITGPESAPGFVSVAVAWRGLVALSNPARHACGTGSGFYNDTEGRGDVHRRLLLVETFIN